MSVVSWIDAGVDIYKLRVDVVAARRLMRNIGVVVIRTVEGNLSSGSRTERVAAQESRVNRGILICCPDAVEGPLSSSVL